MITVGLLLTIFVTVPLLWIYKFIRKGDKRAK